MTATLRRFWVALRAAVRAFAAEFRWTWKVGARPTGDGPYVLLVGPDRDHMVPACAPMLNRKVAYRRYADARKQAPSGRLLNGHDIEREW